MFKETIEKCKQAYKDNNMLVASQLYEHLTEILNEERDKLASQEEKMQVFKEYMEDMELFTDEEIYAITDYLKIKDYYEEVEKENKKLVDITNDKNMNILDDFCNMYEWGIRQCSDDKYYIYDLQCSCVVDNGEEYDIKNLINRIVGRAIDYFRDETMWEDDEKSIEYGEKLYNIALQYKKEDKWEEIWLNGFKEELNI